MPPEKRQRIEELNFADHKPEKSEYPPEKYKNYVACPFSKHDPAHYVNVNNACTQPRGFKDIGDLNYHIQRVHSLRFGCIVCKSRFTQSTRVTVEDAKRTHSCKPRDFSREDPQWMTKEQEARLEKWKEPGKAQEGGARSWTRIYKCLFEIEEEAAPTPFYDYMVPKHLVSNSRRNDSYAASSNDHTIDPSLTGPLASESTGMGSLRVQEEQHGLQALANCEGSDNYPFDWEVTPAVDSAYGSGIAPESQELDGPFSQTQFVSPAETILHPSNTEALIFGVIDNSEQARGDYDELVEVEDEPVHLEDELG